MSYTIVDLLEKFILIERKGYEIFMEIATNQRNPEKLKTLARIFAKEEERHMSVYESMKERMAGETNIEVEFSIYDKASNLVSDFTRSNKKLGIETPKNLLEFCVDFEKENLALALSIRGVLVKSQEDTQSKNYKILSEIIMEEQSHLQNIVYFLK